MSTDGPTFSARRNTIVGADAYIRPRILHFRLRSMSDKPRLRFNAYGVAHFLFAQKGAPKTALKSTYGSLDNLSLVADAYQFGGTQEKTKSLTYIFMLECRFNSLRRLLERIAGE